MKTKQFEVKSQNKVIECTDDGLFTPLVGSWAESKYQLVHMYNQLFATGMKRTWDKRVYIDLFAGSGKAKIRKTKKIVFSSPMLALNIPDQYDKYLFCEEKEEGLNSLKKRVQNEYPEIDAHFILGDCNLVIEEIREKFLNLQKLKRFLLFVLLIHSRLIFNLKQLRNLQ